MKFYPNPFQTFCVMPATVILSVCIHKGANITSLNIVGGGGKQKIQTFSLYYDVITLKQHPDASF